jgi:thymidylate kinase
MRALGHPAALNDRWDIVGDAAMYPSAGFLVHDLPLIRASVAQMPSTSRLLFLLWTMHLSLEGREWDEIVFTDSYWMKHAASEVVYGQDADWVWTVVSALPSADVVVYLRVAPELAWQRIGTAVNAYECGMDFSCSERSFLRHQHAMQEVLDGWARTGGWHVVDAGRPLAEVRREVGELVAAAVARHG